MNDISKKAMYVNQAVVIWLCQMTCIVLVYNYIFANEDVYAAFVGWPKSQSEIIIKFVCSVVLHLYLQVRLRQGMDIMKFVANHSYRFETPILAFTTGFMQASQIVANEWISFLVLVFSTDTLEIIRNFFALVVIADFENFLYTSLQDEPAKDLLT